MHFAIRTALCLMLCVLLVGRADRTLSESAFAQEKLPPALQGVRRIVCLGDSITQMAEDRGGYVWLLRRYLTLLYPQSRIEVVNAGVSGDRSNDMLARFQQAVLDRKPDLITIQVGLNDVWYTHYEEPGYRELPKADGAKGIPLADFRRNVEAMLTRARAAKVKVVLFTITPVYEDLSNRANKTLVAYNQTLRSLARKHNALLTDVAKPFQTLIGTYRETGARDDLLTMDGLHMNALGHRVIINCLLQAWGVPETLRVKAHSTIARERSVSP